MNSFMEFLFTPGGFVTIVAGLVVGYIKRGTWIPWVRKAIGNAIPGDSPLEKVALDKVEEAARAMIASGNVEVIVQEIMKLLTSGGMSAEEAAETPLADVGVAHATARRNMLMSAAIADAGPVTSAPVAVKHSKR